MKALIIEEDKFARSIYESELHQQNVQTIFALDGIDGLEKARTEKPDIIIMELILTKKNGFSLLEELKKDLKIKNTPVVICSMLSQQRDIDEALALGAVKYFPKDAYSLKQVANEVLDLLITQ